MKNKFIKLLLCILLICPIFGIFSDANIYADGDYEVDYINDDGSFKLIGSYSTFAEAKSIMVTNEDYVVRCAASKSPSKIVAMNSGLVYSYTARNGGSKTINLYEKLDSSLYGCGVKICIDSGEEMTYHDTYSTQYSSTLGYQIGWINVTINGFTGYADLEYCDLVPSKYIEKGIVIALGGSTRGTYNVICKQKYYSAEKDGNYTDLVLHYYVGEPTSTTNISAIGYTLHIGVAPSFMSEGVKYYSDDGVNFYSDTKLSNLVGTYYNYYQFLPARTYSKISGSTLDSYLASKNVSGSILAGKGSDFIEDQNEYGVNGTMIYALALNESNFGRSTIAVNKNNLFGWGAFDNNTSNAKTYSSVEECVAAEMADNLSNYMDESSGLYYYSMGPGNKGGGFALKYAADPYWAEKIAKYYYDIDKFANGRNGNLTDYNSETLALITTTGANVYSSASESSSVWYTTENKNTGYQKNLIAVVLEKGEAFTKTRTSNNIDENGLLKPITKPAGYLAPYNATTSVGYIKNSDLQIINEGTTPLSTNKTQANVDESTLVSSATISSASFNGGSLTISGMAFLKGLDFNDSSIISHKLIIKNLETGNTADFDLTTSKENGFTLNDGHTYEYIDFAGTIDLSSVNNGQYVLYIRVTNGKYSRDILLNSSSTKMANVIGKASDIEYRVYENERYGYRLEFEKSSTPLDYSTINKPSARRSFFDMLDGFTLSAVGSNGASISLNAASMIYYCNYSDKANVSYTVYLVKDKTNYMALETDIVDKPNGYGNDLSSTYDTTYIAYTGSGDISSLADGTYNVIIKITNGNYVDYLDATTISNMTFPTITNGNRTYTLSKSSFNNRIQLTITTGE